MNVFHKYTRASLAKNRTRTIVTVIGIILSMALFTAVIEGAYSGIQFLVRSEVASSGAYHGYFPDLTEEEARQVPEAKGINGTAAWQTVGWAEIGSSNRSKPYLLIKAIDEHFPDYAAVHLLSGRMPETDGEILLPAHLATNGDVVIPEGETITLAVGWRKTTDGYALAESNPYEEGTESITGAREKVYTVVGFYTRVDYNLEHFACPGYTALTVGEAEGPVGVLFTVNAPGKYYAILKESGLPFEHEDHNDLLRLSGAVRNDFISGFLYSFAAILVLLISFGSISLIYNSFSISVSERTKQFGILKSVGATKKQIRDSVLYEALLLGAVGIPAGALVGCAGMGITLWALEDAFNTLWRGDTYVRMYLVLNPVALLIAAGVCLVTLLVAAWIPARKAMRLSPIDAVRQSEDVKIRKRDVRAGGWIRALFGFEGMMAKKNFGRNRKRYRSTVVSLFMSVVLFISACSFCYYLTSAVEGVTSLDSGVDLVYSSYDDLGLEASDELLNALLGAEGIVTGTYFTGKDGPEMRFDWEDLTNDPYLSDQFAWPKEQNLPRFPHTGDVFFLEDGAFRALCVDNHLDPGAFFDPDSPAAILYNKQTFYQHTANGSTAWRSYQLVRTDRLPVTATMIEFRRGPEGYILVQTETDEAGETEYIYLPEDEMEAYWASTENVGAADLDLSNALRLTSAQAEYHADLTAVAVIDRLPFPLPTMDVSFIYPYSMMYSVLPEGFQGHMGDENFCFQSRAHAASYEAMKGILASRGRETYWLYDRAGSKESERMLVLIIRVFSYGFIILISLIAVANVFNTISTSIMLRRREFAMLKSIGLGEKGFRRMMNYECVIYGAKSLLFGLPVSFAVSYWIFRASADLYDQAFTVPWYAVALAAGSVFLVVFATMLYATAKIRRDNPIDALKTETL